MPLELGFIEETSWKCGGRDHEVLDKTKKGRCQPSAVTEDHAPNRSIKILPHRMLIGIAYKFAPVSTVPKALSYTFESKTANVDDDPSAKNMRIM